MKDHAKVGSRKGLPGYRTPSSFRYRKDLSLKTVKLGKKFPGQPSQKKYS
ncbi:MAG: hypothetical protein WC516_01200 [Patescibacteria group bacterium]